MYVAETIIPTGDLAPQSKGGRTHFYVPYTQLSGWHLVGAQ